MKRVLFLGSKPLGLSVFRELHLNIKYDELFCAIVDDAKDPRSVYDQFDDYCKERDLPSFTVSTRSDLKSIVDLVHPDICLVCGYYFLIDVVALNNVMDGFVGLHASLLPKYRGNAPLVWAMISGEKKSGVSLFFIDEGMDSGDVIKQESFFIEDDDYIGDVLEKANSACVSLAKYFINNISFLKESAKSQNDAEATYCAKRNESDGLVQWIGSSVDLYNFIKAQSDPYPGAFTFSPKGQKINIKKSSVFDHPCLGNPGQVCLTLNDNVVVSCGSGSLLIEEVAINGISQKPSECFRFNDRLIPRVKWW